MEANTIQVQVKCIAQEATDIKSFELAYADGSCLPPWQPGAHIDVHVGDGLVRQYSLCNGEKIVVTRDMVFDEADRLKASGVEPTNRKLLHELGGSMTTIAGFLRDWKAQQSIAVPGPVETVDVRPPWSTLATRLSVQFGRRAMPKPGARSRR